MIDQTTVFTYLAILLGFMLIPGPAVLLTLARAGTSGTRVGMATGLGIAIGDLMHTAMAVLGLSAIILTSALLFSIVKYLGAAYLIYLGIRAILEKPRRMAAGGIGVLSARQALRQAVLVEVLNPKSAMFFLAFLPQFVNVDRGAVALQLSILGVLFVALGLATNIVVAICAGGVGGLLQNNPAVLRWQGKFTGSIYCALGLRLALQEK